MQVGSLECCVLGQFVLTKPVLVQILTFVWHVCMFLSSCYKQCLRKPLPDLNIMWNTGLSCWRQSTNSATPYQILHVKFSIEDDFVATNGAPSTFICNFLPKTILWSLLALPSKCFICIFLQSKTILWSLLVPPVLITLSLCQQMPQVECWSTAHWSG